MIEIPSLVDIIFDKHASAEDLLILVGVMAIFWAIIFKILIFILTPFVTGKPWIEHALGREYDRFGKKQYEMMGVPITKEEFIRREVPNWVWSMVCAFQHLFGGFLAVPAVFSLVDQELGANVACFSILSEMGWEIQDLISWCGLRFLTKNGADKVPGLKLMVLTTHHSLTILLAIPTIRNYRMEPTLHRLCFDLLFAGGLALYFSEQSKTLDVSKEKDLRKFQLMTILSFITALWARFFDWFYIVYTFMNIWIEDEKWNFVYVGCVAFLLFTFFNFAAVLYPLTVRIMKFNKVKRAHKALPRDVSSEVYSKSVRNLQDAADDVFDVDVTEEIDALFRPRKVDLRATMPATTSNGRPAISKAMLFMNASMSSIPSRKAHFD
jgi:hypothetical protein